MHKLHLAELRDSWSAWLGVCLTFVATNFSLTLSALTLLSAVRALQSGQFAKYDSTALVINPGENLFFCAIIGAIAISTATSLVLDSRRGSLARLALSGATPAQVTASIMVQLATVSVACSVLGDILAYALLQPTLAYLAGEREGELPTPPAVYAVYPALAANVLAVGVAMLGGWKQARRASRIPPVEALRQAQGGQPVKMSVGRWIGSVLWALVIVGSYSAVPAVTAHRTKETFSNLLTGSMILLIVAAAFLACIAPLLVGPLTRLWTAAVPPLDPSWSLARSTAVVKAPRLVKSVVPVMMTIGLLFGMLAIFDTLLATLAANGYDNKLSSAGAATLLVTLFLPLLISLSSGVGSLIMMSKQRDAELALSGIVGTTPTQRLAMPIMEAIIITVTGTLLGLAMVAISVAFLAVSVPAAGFTFAFRPSWAMFAATLGATTLVTVAATLLPTLRSLRLPEPKVIARLVAE